MMKESEQMMEMLDLKILLCDDSLLVRKKVTTALTEAGFKHIFEASDGEEAVAFCKENRPDIVLLDIVMPKKDGIEALKEIKENDPDIYIIMASSVGTQSNLIKALKSGANTFIQKPVTKEAILDAVKQYLEERGDS